MSNMIPGASSVTGCKCCCAGAPQSAIPSITLSSGIPPISMSGVSTSAPPIPAGSIKER